MKSVIILSCVYNDWASAEDLFRALDQQFSQRDWNAHLVLVDDGSHEARPANFLATLQRFSSIEIVGLRRNMGHQRALAIGLSYVLETEKKEPVVVMDADGEDRPEDVVRLVDTFAGGDGTRIIFAERSKRSEGALFRLLYLFYRALHFLLTGYGIRFGNFSIIPPKLIGALVVDPNLWLHYAATVVSARLPFTTIPTERGVRLHGQSKLNLTHMVIHGLSAITCYSEVVGLRLILGTFGLILAITFVMVSVLVIKLATPWAIPGWTSSVMGISGILLLQSLLIMLAFIGVAIGGRKSHFFFPLQQYRVLIDEVHRIR